MLVFWMDQVTDPFLLYYYQVVNQLVGDFS